MCELDRPEQWSLKGEGNANWVFSYAGRLPHLVGKVLRVRKPKPPFAPEQLALEEAVWAPVLGTPSAPSAASAAVEREQAYVQQLLVPLLGQQHVPRQQRVQPRPGFLPRLLDLTDCLPFPDCCDTEAASAGLLAILMPDVTLLLVGSYPSSSKPQAAAPEGPVVCIELKPKCGFIGGGCATVHPANRHFKRTHSRFQLHQMLKLEEGMVTACSAYDPCDLFSGDPGHLRAALAALLEQPQNNLLLFLGGQNQRLPGRQQSRKRRQPQVEEAGGERGAQLQGWQVRATVEGLLAGLLPLPGSQRRAALVELLAGVLEMEGVLPRLLQAQQQCQYDIEGIYRLYCHLAGVLPAAMGNSGSSSGIASEAPAEEAADAEAHAAAAQQLLALPLAEAFAVLRSYIVAATAKDCAIMITLQRLSATGPGAAAYGDDAAEPGGCGSASTDTQPQQEWGQQREQQQERHAVQHEPQGQQQQQEQPLPVGRIFCPSVGTWYAYRLVLVDLDQKPLAKIVQHRELDAAILAAARRHLASSNDGSDAAGGSGGAEPLTAASVDVAR